MRSRPALTGFVICALALPVGALGAESSGASEGLSATCHAPMARGGSSAASPPGGSWRALGSLLLPVRGGGGFTDGGSDPSAEDEDGDSDSDASDDGATSGESAGNDATSQGATGSATAPADGALGNGTEGGASSPGRSRSAMSLLEWLAGIIFGQDRPWESDKRGSRR